jgi:hypothetical protein
MPVLGTDAPIDATVRTGLKKHIRGPLGSRTHISLFAEATERFTRSRRPHIEPDLHCGWERQVTYTESESP